MIFNIMNKIKHIYYKLKYRTKDGSMAIIVGNIKENDKFGKACDKYANTLESCYKTNAEVLEYIRSKYGLRKENLTVSDAEGYKINYILNQHPELISIPETKMLSSDKMPSRKEFIEQHEINMKRVNEARLYPLEKLNLELEKYKFVYALSNGDIVEFTMLVDNTNDKFTVSSSVNRKTTEEEQALIHRIHEEIDMYKGITKEDIEKRTPRFLGYVSTLIRLSKETNQDI